MIANTNISTTIVPHLLCNTLKARISPRGKRKHRENFPFYDFDCLFTVISMSEKFMYNHVYKIKPSGGFFVISLSLFLCLNCHIFLR